MKEDIPTNKNVNFSHVLWTGKLIINNPRRNANLTSVKSASGGLSSIVVLVLS